MKLLLVRFSSLGDVVLATAAANYIKSEVPDAELYFLTREPYAGLLEGHPALKAVWTWNGDLWAMRQRLRAEGIEKILDLHAKGTSRLLSALSGLPSTRIKNYALQRRLLVWIKRKPWPPLPDVATRGIEAASTLIQREPKASRPTLSLDSAAQAWADDFYKEGGLENSEPLLALCPGASWATKRWPTEHFAASLQALRAENCRFLFVGDQLDAALATKICRQAGIETRSLLAAGRTSLKQLAALLSRCQVLLSNDSGPMHVASALGVPVLALFGPTVEAFGFFPKGERDRVFEKNLACRPCSVHGGPACPIGTHECMTALRPEAVVNAAREILHA